MRETVRDRERLQHIIEAIDRVLDFTKDKSKEVLEDDKIAFYGIVKNIEIIGEAAYHITKAFCSAHSETPWKDVVRMRNILVHDYYRISTNEIWRVVENDLIPLREQVARYLSDTDWDEWQSNEQAIAESAVHKNLIQTARRMKSDGMDVRQISRYTGLSIDEIEQI